MSNEVDTNADSDDGEKPAPVEPYVPPASSCTADELLVMTPAQLKAKIVDCPTCPVFMLCSEGVGGTGYHCGACGSTGVWVYEPNYNTEIPKDVIVVDCKAHKFERAERRKLKLCVLCTGNLAQLEIPKRGARNHIILTVHAGVTAPKRQTVLKEAWVKWTKFYEDETKAKAAEKKAKKAKKAS
jgi:hypothetical protein